MLVLPLLVQVSWMTTAMAPMLLALPLVESMALLKALSCTLSRWVAHSSTVDSEII